MDKVPAEIDPFMQPERELIGSISDTLDLLTEEISAYQLPEDSQAYLTQLQEKMTERDIIPTHQLENRLHPLEIIETMQAAVTDDMTVTVDIGSHYIWMARHFRSYEPRKLLFSNGMQTLGVALPWAIGAALVRPNTQIFSVSGDGGFLFSAQDLETAVRKKLNIIHIIWNDGRYNMVEFQEVMKYDRASGVDFGPVDFVQYAQAFGAKGLRATSQQELEAAIQEGLTTDGPVIIDVPVDYSSNEQLGEKILPDQFY